MYVPWCCASGPDEPSQSIHVLLLHGRMQGDEGLRRPACQTQTRRVRCTSQRRLPLHMHTAKHKRVGMTVTRDNRGPTWPECYCTRIWNTMMAPTTSWRMVCPAFHVSSILPFYPPLSDARLLLLWLFRIGSVFAFDPRTNVQGHHV